MAECNRSRKQSYKTIGHPTTHSHLRSYPPTPLHTHIPRLSSFIKTCVDELNDLLLNYSRIFDRIFEY